MGRRNLKTGKRLASVTEVKEIKKAKYDVETTAKWLEEYYLKKAEGELIWHYVTVFTPAYNRASTLPRTYQSLCEQECKDFIWLIVDDGSK